MKRYSVVFILALGLMILGCSNPQSRKDLFQQMEGAVAHSQKNKSDDGALRPASGANARLSGDSSEDTHDAYRSLILPEGSRLLKGENGIYTIVDSLPIPTDTILSPVCGGIGSIIIEDAFKLITQIDIVDERDPDLTLLATYNCDELKVVEVKYGKLCFSDMMGNDRFCIDLTACTAITVQAKGDGTIKLFAPRTGCAISPY